MNPFALFLGAFFLGVIVTALQRNKAAAPVDPALLIIPPAPPRIDTHKHYTAIMESIDVHAWANVHAKTVVLSDVVLPHISVALLVARPGLTLLPINKPEGWFYVSEYSIHDIEFQYEMKAILEGTKVGQTA